MKKAIVLFLICYTVQTISGQGFKTSSISVFKNGLAFVQKEAKVKVKDKQAVLYDLGTTSDTTVNLDDELEELKFGSLWFRSPGGALHSVSRFTSSVETSTPILNLTELLDLNAGKPATFFFRDTHAANDPAIRKDPVQVVADTWTLNGGFLMLSSAGKWRNAHLKDLEGVEFLAKPNLKRKTSKEEMGLHLQFNNNQSSQDIQMMYVRNGIYWVPTYHLDLVSGGKAKIRLVANLLNDVEDIEDCHMNFVAGVPNFKFRDIATPMGSDLSVAQFMQELASLRVALTGQTPTNPMNLNSAAFSNSISYNYSAQDNTVTQNTQRFIVQSEGGLEDGMFLYEKENVSLRKGGRALIDLFETTVPVSRIYRTELPGNTITTLNQNSTRGKVIQSFKLENTSGRPWTHGPVFVTDSRGKYIKPIANDKILFTPANMPAYVKAADANDILIYHEEHESTGNIQGLTGWKKLTMDASFSLTNLRNETVTVEVERILEGNPKQTTKGWKQKVLRKKLRKQNQMTQITWEVKLKPQETIKVKYDYTINNYR